MTLETIDEQLDYISAMAVSENGQCIAIACKFLKDPSAHILCFDPSQNNYLRKVGKEIQEGTPTDIEEKTFTSIGFSMDAKYVIGLTNYPDGKVKIYEWRKEVRIIGATAWSAEIKKESKENEYAEVSKVSLDPNNKDQACFSGRNHARVWRNQVGILKLAPAISKLEQKKNYTEHAWLENNWLVFGTEQGELSFVYDCKECLKQANAFGEISEPISCLYLCFAGLFIGGETGQIAIWGIDKRGIKEEQTYQFDRSMSN